MEKNMETTVACWGYTGNNGKEHGNTILGLSAPETALTASLTGGLAAEFPGPGQINASHIMSYSLNSLRVILGSIIELIKGEILGV